MTDRNLNRAVVAPVLVLAVWVFPGLGRAAIGDPCDANGVCPAGLTCMPEEGTTGYCTARCPDAGCPEGFTCRSGGAPFEMCLKGPPTTASGVMGDACAGPDECTQPLTCFADNADQYCTRYCTVPGSCPAGFHCQGNDAPACQRLHGLPSSLEPCADGQCAAGWECITHPARTLAFCSFPCPAGTCPGGQECVQGHCLPNPLPLTPKFGEKCVADGLEPSVVGCEQGAFCLLSGNDSYCSRVCDIDKPCPDGYGCRGISPDHAECRRGLPNDDYYNAPELTDGGFLTPPDAAFVPQQVVDAGPRGGGKKASGCDTAPGEVPGLGRMVLLIAAMASMWVVLRRRSPRK